MGAAAYGDDAQFGIQTLFKLRSEVQGADGIRFSIGIHQHLYHLPCFPFSLRAATAVSAGLKRSLSPGKPLSIAKLGG
jgi:hypothetical protein